MTQAEIADMFQVVQRVSAVVEKHHNASSLTIGIQDGPDAGQSIKVCLLHLQCINENINFSHEYLHLYIVSC